MRFTKKFPINLSPKYLAMLMLGGASLFASCDKEDEPARDIELPFYENPTSYDYDPIEPSNLKQYIADPTIRNIYMKVTDQNDYSHLAAPNLRTLHGYLEDRINVCPQKIRGRGNFKFPVGNIEKSDSLWFVQNGWTINQHLQNQKQK